MTTTVSWPNQASPGLCPFRIRVPGDWTAVEPPGALIAFLGPERDGFRANVVVFGERLSAELTPGDVAERTLLEAGAEVITQPVGTADRPAVREATIGVRGCDFRQLVRVTEQPDWSPGALRTVYPLLATQLTGGSGADGDALPDILSSFIADRTGAVTRNPHQGNDTRLFTFPQDRRRPPRG